MEKARGVEAPGRRARQYNTRFNGEIRGAMGREGTLRKPVGDSLRGAGAKNGGCGTTPVATAVHTLISIYIMLSLADITAWHDYIDREVADVDFKDVSLYQRALAEVVLLFERFLTAFPVVPGADTCFCCFLLVSQIRIDLVSLPNY